MMHGFLAEVGPNWQCCKRSSRLALFPWSADQAFHAGNISIVIATADDESAIAIIGVPRNSHDWPLLLHGPDHVVGGLRRSGKHCK
jgi:hypothetical protein